LSAHGSCARWCSWRRLTTEYSRSRARSGTTAPLRSAARCVPGPARRRQSIGHS
jgi:hypothetical protein